MAVDVEKVVLELDVLGNAADELRNQENIARAHAVAVANMSATMDKAKASTAALASSSRSSAAATGAARRQTVAATSATSRLASAQRAQERATKSAASAVRVNAQGMAQLGQAVGRVYIRTRTLILSFIGLKSMAVLVRNALRTLNAGMSEYLARNNDAQRSVHGLRDSLKDLNGAIGEAILGGGNAEVMFGALNHAMERVKEIIEGSTGEMQSMSRVMSADIASVGIFVAQSMIRFGQAINVVRNAFALLKWGAEVAINGLAMSWEGLKITFAAGARLLLQSMRFLVDGMVSAGQFLGQEMLGSQRTVAAMDLAIADLTSTISGQVDMASRYAGAISTATREMDDYVTANALAIEAQERQIENLGELGRELRSGIMTGAAAGWQRFGAAIRESGDATREQVFWFQRMIDLMKPWADLWEATMAKVVQSQNEQIERSRVLYEEKLAQKELNARFMQSERDFAIDLIKAEQDLINTRRDGWAAALSEAKSFSKEYGAIQAGLLLVEAFITARKAVMNLATPGMQGFGVAQGIAAADAIREAYRLGAKGGGGGGTRSGPAQVSQQNIANIYVNQNNSGIGVNGGDMARSLAPIMQSAFDNHHVVVRS